MSTKRTMLIAALVSDCGNAASGVLFEALNAELARYDYKMVLAVGGMSKEKGREMLQAFSTGIVDGIINMMYQIETNEAKHICNPIPVITFLRQDSAPIYIDFENAAIQALEYLWSQGHRRIGLITSNTRVYNGVEPCLTGYKQFMSSKGETFDPQLIFEGNNTCDCGIIAAEQLYKHDITAIFAGNDQMASGVYQWAYQNNLRIPDDLSVIGFDDSPLATAVCPPLTTIQFPNQEVSRHTVDSLMAKIGGHPDMAQTKIIRPTLIIRRSTQSI